MNSETNSSTALAPQTPPPALPVTVGTWDGARQWLNYAQRCEQMKVYCQVMLGFELVSLRKSLGVQPGGDRKSDSYRGNLLPRGDTWETILTRETGLSQSTAYRFMQMADAAKPRLKRIPALRNWDPVSTPIALLDAPQAKALETGVKKLTDGLTQREFGEQFGLWKKPQGSAARGGNLKDPNAPKTDLTPSEQADLLKLQATEDWHHLDQLLRVYRDKFLVLSDPEIDAQIAALEQALNARKTWLKQPQNARDPQTVAALF